MNPKPLNAVPGLLTTARFLCFFSLAIWLGGIVFFGAIAIPAAKSFDRALVPLMVGAMLARFTPVLYICGALLLVGWGLERVARGMMDHRNRKLWMAQGMCSTLMLAIALYLGLVLMPSLQAAQRAAGGGDVARQTMAQASTAQSTTTQSAGLETRKSIVIPLPAPVAGAEKSRFDAQHKRYTQLTMLSVWLALATLVLLCVRLSRVVPPHEYSCAGQQAEHEAAATSNA